MGRVILEMIADVFLGSENVIRGLSTRVDIQRQVEQLNLVIDFG